MKSDASRRAFLLACAASAARAQDSPQDRAWQSLFDGKTTAGWLEVTGRPFPIECWAIDGGCLKAFPGPHGNQDIRTAESYSDFEFAFSWRILKGGNSGVKYLVQNTDRWTNAAGLQARARGPEFQLVDSDIDDASDPTRKSGALYSVLAPTTHAARRPGEWNNSRLIVQAGRVEHWINGARVLAYSLAQHEVIKLLEEHRKSKDIVISSPICLQNHGSPVWFRDLKVRKL
ncbi:MAG TPA: DUF1080 domain-containing protein [Candidatus Solibacter sp.]|nr:DUF1080 domain-containing protein [Candidatus Solibacter sp.]